MKPERSSEERAMALVPLHQLVRQHRGHISAERLTQGRHSFVTALRRAHRTRSAIPWPRAYAVAFACVAILCLVGAGRWFLRTSERTLTYVVEGGQADARGVIARGPSGEPRIHFSDGTEVRVVGTGKAVVDRVDVRGARVSVVEGTVLADVVHADRTQWLFDAGPFRVTVTGTSFTMSWSQSSEQLDMQMIRGSVAVAGPLSDTPMLLRAGQHLTVRVRERETVIRDLDSSVPVATTGSLGMAEPMPKADRNETTAVEAPSPSNVDDKRKGTHLPPLKTSEWSHKLAQGKVDEVLGEAERFGLHRCLAELGPSDLATLADAARYGRRNDFARSTLRALRKRFPASTSARDAAFLLGRLDESEGHQEQALTWYTSYLGEAPNGTYASEAMGRKMILTRALRGDGPARLLANDYLSRFPRGAYAPLATALQRAP